MWLLQRVQESLPVEISRLVSKDSEAISAKADLLNKLHSNVLTPDKIPDFFLPPRLSRRSLVAAEGVSQLLVETGLDCKQASRPNPDMTTVKADVNKGAGVGLKGPKPVPFSLKSYESGLFESPNTRRKESLFHSAFTHYTLERVTTRVTPKLPSITLLKVGSVESDTSSSADSSPHSSPPPSWPIRRKWDNMTSLSHLASKEKLSKNVLLSFRNTEKIQPTRTEVTKKATTTKGYHETVAQELRCSTLAPSLQFSLDMLHCQERLHSAHVLPLPHRGCVRLSASHSNTTRDLATVCIRVVSVEGLCESSDLRPLHCGLTLSLTPGKLQRQHSAIIRNCRNPVFNEDFFFTEPVGEEGRLRVLALRLKVLDKASGLGRAAVLGVIVKPLSELLPL